MGRKLKRTKNELLQDIVNEYIASGQPWPADRRTISAWAVTNKKWKPQSKSVIDQCAKELAAAMRAEMERDPQGRTVRAKHCASILREDENGNKVQQRLWFGRDAEPGLIHVAFQQRRKAILGDNRQLKTDQDSYNDNNEYGAEIKLSFNYEQDLLEEELGTEYKPPEDDLDGLD